MVTSTTAFRTMLNRRYPGTTATKLRYATPTNGTAWRDGAFLLSKPLAQIDGEMYHQRMLENGQYIVFVGSGWTAEDIERVSSSPVSYTAEHYYKTGTSCPTWEFNAKGWLLQQGLLIKHCTRHTSNDPHHIIFATTDTDVEHILFNETRPYTAITVVITSDQWLNLKPKFEPVNYVYSPETGLLHLLVKNNKYQSPTAQHATAIAQTSELLPALLQALWTNNKQRFDDLWSKYVFVQQQLDGKHYLTGDQVFREMRERVCENDTPIARVIPTMTTEFDDF